MIDRISLLRKTKDVLYWRRHYGLREEQAQSGKSLKTFQSWQKYPKIIIIGGLCYSGNWESRILKTGSRRQTTIGWAKKNWTISDLDLQPSILKTTIFQLPNSLLFYLFTNVSQQTLGQPFLWIQTFLEFYLRLFSFFRMERSALLSSNLPLWEQRGLKKQTD